MSSDPSGVPGPVVPAVPMPVVNPAKLQPPRATHQIVGHDRLLGLRPDPVDASVVRVVAPAGYGKTTLLAEWIDHDPGTVLWLALDQHDSDPMTLVTHIAEAVLETGAPAPGLKASIMTPAASIWSALMPRLAVALQALTPFTLMFDDVHALTAPASRDVIDWLTLHVPPGAQVILAGRSDIGSSTARLRARGDLVDRGSQDLALTDREAHQLLLARGMEATPDDAARLNDLCGGWVSGLLMSTMAASVDRGTAGSAVPEGLERLVGDYLRAEVLEQLTAEEREFMLQASVLRAASGPLCDAMLERTGSERLLERLYVANAFVAKTGDGWWRVHDLLRSALLVQFERADPARVTILRSRAAAWHASHGNPVEAVHYSMESGLDDETIGFIAESTVVTYSLGRQATVDEWLDWVEEKGLVSRDSSLTTAGSVLSALSGWPERSERWTASARRPAGDRPIPHADSLAEGHRALMHAWQCRRGAKAMLVDATRACELVPDEGSWRESALGALAVAQLMNGLDAESVSSLREIAAASGPARVDTNAHSAAAVFLARRALLDHDLDAARSWLERSTAIRVTSGITEQPLQAFEDAVAARLAMVLGSGVEEARRSLAHAQTIRPLLTWAVPGLAVPVRLELVKAHLSLADLAASRMLMHEVFDILHRRPGLGAFEAEAHELRERVAEQAESIAGPSSLTAAELRMVPWLATHLSFREIGERLFLSTNTVKTEALATYRKLGVSSRSEAVEAAVAAGLLDPASLPGILHAAFRGASQPD